MPTSPIVCTQNCARIMQLIALALALTFMIPHREWASVLTQQPNEIGGRQGEDDYLSK